MRKDAGLSVSDEIILTYKGNGDIEEIINMFRDDIKRKLLARDIKSGEETKVEKI